MERIAITMQKGGAGKTTTALNLSAYLARKGKKILLIDFDPQASLTLVTGLAEEAAKGPTAYELLMDSNAAAVDLARRSQIAGVDVIPATEGLAGAEVLLTNKMAREAQLRDKLAAIPPQSYDYVFIDTRPSLGLLTINALVAAQSVLIPIRADYLTYAKLPELFQTFNQIGDSLKHQLRIWGALILAYDEQKLECRLVKAEIERFFTDAKERAALFKTVIRESAMIGRAHLEHKDLEILAPHSIAATDYRALAQEVLSRAAQDVAA